MIPVKAEITEYSKEKNTCKAKLLNGDIIYLDPYVGCALPLTDEEYHNGEGYKLVGKTFILVIYTVYKDQVVPHENGMIEI